MEAILQEEISRLHKRIAELEHQLSLSVVSTGVRMQHNGVRLEQVVETTEPELVITTKKYIKELLL